LKKEVSIAKESLKVSSDLTESRDRLSSRDNMYQFLDDDTRAKVALKDVKIGLLKEHIDKAKARQMELLKGGVKKLNRDCDLILGQILKAKIQYEKMDEDSEGNKARLERYYDVEQFDNIAGDLLNRDMIAVDSALLSRDRR
jgi:hypothetical protein